MSQAPKESPGETKPDLSLIPIGLISEFLEPAYQEGIIKYYRESWKLGFPTTNMYAGLLRHILAYMDGEDYDPSAAKLGIQKHHLAGALFCIICMLDTFKNHPEMDDRGKDFKPEGWNKEMMLNKIREAKENYLLSKLESDDE